MEFSSAPRKTTFSEISGQVNLSEKNVIGILARAQNYEFCRQIQEGLECLSPLWSNYTERPLTAPYTVAVQAEILLRCGALLSYLDGYKYLDSQELARDWLTESVEKFRSVGISDKIAEAETELAMTYWRESRHSESFTWLEAASAKVVNPLNAVKIKNISYQLLVLFSLNTPLSLQAGLALIKDQDICVELCEDSRVKVHYYNNSALLMTRIGQMADALVRHQKCVHFCLEVGNRFSLAIAENNVGFVYNHFKQFDKAVEHANKAIKVCQELGFTIRESECYDTLAQICLNRQVELKSDDFSEAWQAINKSLDVLLPMGFRKGYNTILTQSGDSSSLISSLQTKAKILLHQGEKIAALTLFSTIYQMILTNIGETAAERYAADFAQTIEFTHGTSFIEKTTRFERKLIESAITASNGNLTNISEHLGITDEHLINLFETRHGDLQKRYQVKNNTAKVSRRFKKNSPKTPKRLNDDPAMSGGMLKSYDYKGFPAYIPASVNIRLFLPIVEARLASLGLVEGRIAVVGEPSSADETYPLVIREYLNNTYHYGYRIDSMDLIGLEADDPYVFNLRVFDPEIIEQVGSIIGYCEFNFEDKIYNYHPIKSFPK